MVSTKTIRSKQVNWRAPTSSRVLLGSRIQSSWSRLMIRFCVCAHYSACIKTRHRKEDKPCGHERQYRASLCLCLVSFPSTKHLTSMTHQGQGFCKAWTQHLSWPLHFRQHCHSQPAFQALTFPNKVHQSLNSQRPEIQVLQNDTLLSTELKAFDDADSEGGVWDGVELCGERFMMFKVGCRGGHGV